LFGYFEVTSKVKVNRTARRIRRARQWITKSNSIKEQKQIEKSSRKCLKTKRKSAAKLTK
jgi:hypothetical protein